VPRLEADNESSIDSLQDGVKGMEAISQAWNRTSLIVAYCSLLLLAFIQSMEGQVTWPALAFVTSSFAAHSMVSTVSVVGSVINAVIKPPMAKLADVFGRLEAFCLCILFYILGMIQMAASNNVGTFASAQIFYSAGNTGLQILQQIFIADTTDLGYRALFSTLPDLPFLATTWFGSIITTRIMADTGSWRWVYGMWAIIVPATFLPLGLSLFINARRAKKMGLSVPHTTLKGGPVKVLGNLWRDLDVGGILLLTAGFSLILIPCTIANTTGGGWDNPDMIALVTVGAICLVIFPFWEMASKFSKQHGLTGLKATILNNLSPFPLVPLYLFKSRTFSAGCILAFFYFMAFYLSVQPYFYSYLLVVRGLEIQPSSYILNIFNQSATVSSIIVSLLIKFTNRYKWFVVIGTGLYMLGMGLMMHYRTEEAPLSAIIGTQILIGFGGGMLNVPAQLGVQASAGHQQLAVATAMFLTLISLGGAVGSAISGAIWSQMVPAKLAAYLPDDAKNQTMLLFGDFNQILLYPQGSPIRVAANRSYQETMTTLLTIAVCICAPVVICALLMTDYKLDEMEQGVKGKVIGGVVDENRKKTEKGSFLGNIASKFRRSS